MISLALKRILHNRILSIISILAIALSFIVFLLLHSALDAYADRLTDRTKGEILVAGRPGANVDLIMDALYFRQGNHSFIKMSDLDSIKDKAKTVAVFNVYSLKGSPLIGTELEYFEIRDLSLQSGHLFTQMGECILGSKVAMNLGLKINDKIISKMDTIFDI